MTSWLCPSKVLGDQNFLWGPYGGGLSTERGDAAVAARRGSGGSLCFPGLFSAELELEWPQRLEAPVPNIREGYEECYLPASRVETFSKALNREGRVLFVCYMGTAFPSSIGRSIGRLRMPKPKPEIPPLNLLGT